MTIVKCPLCGVEVAWVASDQEAALLEAGATELPGPYDDQRALCRSCLEKIKP